MTTGVTRLVVAAVAAAVLLSGCGAVGGAAGGGGDDRVAKAASDVAATPHGAATHQATLAPPVSPLRAGERFQVIGVPQPYLPKPPNGGTDDYRCFIVDPKITEPTYLVGSQFLPQNADTVHHAIFFKLEPNEVAEATKLDAAEEGDGYTCFSGTGIGGQGGQLRGAPWLAAWAPGGTESLANPGTGFLLQPGTKIIMQVHYNLLATEGKAAGTDQSSLRLRLASGTAPLKELHTQLLVAPVELPCAPGETGKLCDRELAVFDVMRRFGDKAGFTIAGLNLLCSAATPKPGSTQSCDRTVRQDMVVQSVGGHMHLLGKSISVSLNPGKADARTLLNVPVYNFDDQGARKMAKPVRVSPGDTLRVTCTHDATLRSKLPALQTLKPRYVVWGEGTSDEMCLGVVVWSEP